MRYIILVVGVKLLLLGFALSSENTIEYAEAGVTEKEIYVMSETEYADYLKKNEAREIKIEVEIDWTTERIEQEIRATFPENPDLAVAIAKSESGESLNAHAFNPEQHIGCSGSYGVMQIACVHEATPEYLFDVQYNLQQARKIYDEQGWEPWGGYTSNGYMKYM